MDRDTVNIRAGSTANKTGVDGETWEMQGKGEGRKNLSDRGNEEWGGGEVWEETDKRTVPI